MVDDRQFADLGNLRANVIEMIGRRPGVTIAARDPDDPAKINVRIDGRNLTVDLTNLVNRIRGYPDANPDKLVAEFVTGMAGTNAGSVSVENLVAVLRDASFVQLASRKMEGGPLVEPFIGDLMIVYMADLPTSMAVVGRSKMPDMKLDELRTMALHNVGKWLGQIRSQAPWPFATLYFVEGNTMLSPTLVLLKEFWASIATRYPGDTLIAVPRRDQLFVADDSPDGQALLRRLIDVTFADNFSLLSRQIFARRGGKFVAVGN